jgi:hypothetical protein
METVEALKAFHQNFFVTGALFRPTFQDLCNAESFDTMKFLITDRLLGTFTEYIDFRY